MGLLRGVSATFADWRNKVLASPAFQDWASVSPLTASISNAYARSLFDMAVGFSYARILHACVRLGVFGHLREGPLSVARLAEACEMPASSMRTLALAASALKLLEHCGEDRFRLGPKGAALLGNPGVEAMIRHHSLLYADLADPVALLRGDIAQPQVSRFWAYGEDQSPVAAEAYSALMASTQAMIARQVVHAYDFRTRQALMDIGGGEGVFAAHAARMAPDLRVLVVDLPAVAARAQAASEASKLHDRVSAVGLDARTQALPSGYDTISFVRVLHDHDDDDVMRLLVAARAALAGRGQVLIAEPLAKTPGAEAMGHGYFGMYLLAMGRGRPRTKAELTRMARDAGFRTVRERRVSQPVLVRVLIAD